MKTSLAKRVAIVQSNYIPWKGYFDLINMVDEMILYDDVQYTRRDWRNRNIIKTPSGPRWLTIPVQVKGKYSQKINETRVSDPGWGKKHWTTIVHNYARAKHFRQTAQVFEPLFMENREHYLSQINFRFIAATCAFLGIASKLSWSTDYPYVEGRNERLISLCSSAGAVEYVSGPAAKSYIDEALFRRHAIAVTYMDYSGYPVYEQLYGEFEHGVTILDLLFNEGPKATQFMKSFASTN
jgi:hypothetical protein